MSKNNHILTVDFFVHNYTPLYIYICTYFLLYEYIDLYIKQLELLVVT